MSNSKHTPGPWYVDDTWGLIMADKGAVEVAACHAGRGNDTNANARLIAAAPELLTVLHRAVIELEYAKGGILQFKDYASMLADFRQAIAKAEGRDK